MKIIIFVLFVSIIGIYSVQAKETLSVPLLAFPLECELGLNCWIVNYPDVDNGPGALDYNCGYKTYDTHKGTDFAIQNRNVMKKGINVKAVLDGIVLRTRDGESDIPKDENGYKALLNMDKGCGNGIVIAHENGLEAQYCHLKEGSIQVKPQDRISAGDVIAQVGQSGAASFPHLHISITQDGELIDPFTGHATKEGCQVTNVQNMWEDSISYEPYSIFNTGFSDDVPDWNKMKAADVVVPDLLRLDSQHFVYWALFYHAHAGDKIEMTIYAPNGEIFVERAEDIKENKKTYFMYVGSALKTQKLMPGTYFGLTRYTRPGYEPYTVRQHVEVR